MVIGLQPRGRRIETYHRYFFLTHSVCRHNLTFIALKILMHNRSPWRTPARGPPAKLLECLFFIYSLFKCFLLWCSHTTSLLHILCCTYYCKYIYRLILPLLIRFAHSLLSPVYSYGDNAGGSTFFILQFSRLSTLHFLTVEIPPDSRHFIF